MPLQPPPPRPGRHDDAKRPTTPPSLSRPRSPEIDPVEVVASALREQGCRPTRSANGYEAVCPAHEDSQPSLSVGRGDGGDALIRCHAGCEPEAVTDALGLRMEDLFLSLPEDSARRERISESKPTFPTWQDAAASYPLGDSDRHWTYVDEAGDVVLVVLRWDQPDGGKIVRPISKVDGVWVRGNASKSRPIYNLPNVANADRVFVVEGEKVCDAAASLGLIAATSSQGAESPQLTDWSPLAGKDVVILPDKDTAGRKYAEAVVALLTRLPSPPTIRVVNLPNVPDGGDLVDWLDVQEGDDEAARRELERLVDAAEIVAPADTDSFSSVDIPRERIQFEFVSPSEMAPPEPADWLFPNFVASGAITLWTSIWKCGKSTLFASLIRDLQHGGRLARRRPGLKVVVVSEESESRWSERAADLGLNDDLKLMRTPFHGRPTWGQWEALTRRLVGFTKEHAGEVLVIFDTLPYFWPVNDENDAAAALRALSPLRRVSEAGAAIILAAHPRKSEAAPFAGTRGSGAIAGFADILVEMLYRNQQDAACTKRLLKARGRFDEIPPETIIDRQDGQYVVLGEPLKDDLGARLDAIAKILSEASGPLGYDDIFKRLPAGAMSEKAMKGALTIGEQDGLFHRTRGGEKNNKHLFSLADDAVDDLNGEATNGQALSPDKSSGTMAE